MSSDGILIDNDNMFKLIKELNETRELVDDNTVLRYRYKIMAQTLDSILMSGGIEKLRKKCIDIYAKYNLKKQIIQEEELFEQFDDR